MNATILEYEPVTRYLDGLNERHISTYPAGFPSKTRSIPFLYEELRTPEAVFFQVFVRDGEVKSGPNPIAKHYLVAWKPRVRRPGCDLATPTVPKYW